MQTVVSVLLMVASSNPASPTPDASANRARPCAFEIAASDLIIQAKLVDVAERGGGQLLDLELEPIAFLKGTTTGMLRATAHLVLLNTPADDIRALDGQEVLALLMRRDDPTNSGVFLTPKSRSAGCPSIRRHEAAKWSSLEQEVRWQEGVALPAVDGALAPHVDRVRAIVGRLVRKKTQRAAIEELQALDVSAVPALIALLDDRRKLPSEHMAMRTSGGFEATATYAPRQVVDVLSVILERLTGESFGSLHHGGSERERDRVVKGWRVYLALQAEPKS